MSVCMNATINSKKAKVLVAMSGGVDSSVAAALLMEQGYAVEGITMYLGESSVVEKAAKTAEFLGIRHHTVDLSLLFQEQVQAYFIREYLSGHTPNPCVMCNKKVKMGSLFEYAIQLGADYFATGHYANVVKEQERYLLKKAVYLPKDQSYVLYSLSQEVLSKLILPLQAFSKDEVRAKAKALGLPCASASDSQDICFIPSGDYHQFLIEEGIPDAPGNFVNKNGTVLGKHKGIFHYTVGQRKGLGIALGHPVYVTEIRPQTNEVVLGLTDDLYSANMFTENNNFIAIENLVEELSVEVKIRYNFAPVAAMIKPVKAGLVETVFEKPVKAVTKGQAAVFYQGDIVIGGGIIV